MSTLDGTSAPAPLLSASQHGGGAASLAFNASQGSASLPFLGPQVGKRFRASSSAALRAAGNRHGADGGGESGRGGSNLAALRARARAASQAGRAQSVAAYRSYRKGELPDVQISATDLLAPLQALVHHDALVC